MDCLRQLAHREAKDICDLGRVIIENNDEVVKKMYISNRGLEGIVSYSTSFILLVHGFDTFAFLLFLSVLQKSCLKLTPYDNSLISNH